MGITRSPADFTFDNVLWDPSLNSAKRGRVCAINYRAIYSCCVTHGQVLVSCFTGLIILSRYSGEYFTYAIGSRVGAAGSVRYCLSLPRVLIWFGPWHSVGASGR